MSDVPDFAKTCPPGTRIGAVFGLGLVADTMTVNARRAGTLIYSSTKELGQRLARNAFEYCFNAFDSAPSAVFTDMPLDTALEIEVILTRAGGEVITDY